MPDGKPEPGWSEWGRYTLSAVAGAGVALVFVTLWLSDVSHAAADASRIGDENSARLSKLTEIGNDIRSVLVRLETRDEQQAADIKALKDRVFGGK